LERTYVVLLQDHPEVQDWQMVLILRDGTVCDVIDMFDVDGDETDDPERAFSVVVKHPDGRWIAQQVGPEMRIRKSESN
jgi:hypothetical protein